ncbi:hypothetical protein SRHO_G00169460 [Serrasalmus rhombeus]
MAVKNRAKERELVIPEQQSREGRPTSEIFRTRFLRGRAPLAVMGRNVILFRVFGSLSEMQGRSVVFYVFYLWSCMEVFRKDFLCSE